MLGYEFIHSLFPHFQQKGPPIISLRGGDEEPKADFPPCWMTYSDPNCFRYNEYLDLDRILQYPPTLYGSNILFDPNSAEDRGIHRAEQLFILTHQVVEKWIQEVVVNLDEAMKCLREAGANNLSPLRAARGAMERAVACLKASMASPAPLRTMQPYQFDAFRPYLGSMSGADSLGFRSIEGRLGIITSFEKPGVERLPRYEGPTIYEVFLDFVKRTDRAALEDAGISIPANPNDHEDTQREAVKSLTSYCLKEEGRVRFFVLCFLQCEHSLLLFRKAHAKIAETFINNKIGSGGTSGALYLLQTIALSPWGKVFFEGVKTSIADLPSGSFHEELRTVVSSISSILAQAQAEAGTLAE